MSRRLRQLLCLVAATVLACLGQPPALAQPPVKRVLIVHDGPEAFPGNAGFDAELRRVLFSHPTVQLEVHSEYLENEEFVDTAEASLREYIRLKFVHHLPDAIIANAAPALEFVIRLRDELFPDVPVVFIAAAPPAAMAERRIGGVTGILRQTSQAETVDLALKIHPTTRRFHVVAYAPAVEGFQARVASALAAFSPRVTITFTNEPTLPEMLAALRALPPDSLIFFARYSPVTKGRVIFPDELLPEIAEAAPVPIYSSLDRNLGKGVVGGMMRNTVADAISLGGMVLRVLEGTAAESIPVEAASFRPAFDWQQLKRWKIDESRLPEGAEIRFRDPTAWELYGFYIIATSIVVLAQLVLIAGLLSQRTRLRRAESRIRGSEASVRTSFDRIRNMAGRLINAQEAARANLARDLHDEVSQKLMFVSLGISNLKKAAGSLDPHTHRKLEELSRDTQSTLESIRRLSHELHPATLHLLGLAPALRAHCYEVAKRQEVTVRFSSSDDMGTVHPVVALCFFRIAQESVRNAITHGGAQQLAVTLTRAEDRLELTVTDDGRGFNVDTARAQGGGLGLITIEERANAIGGEVTISSEIGKGTTVHLSGPAHPVPPSWAS